MFFNKEIRKELADFKKELKKRELAMKSQLSCKTDMAFLEEVIQEANQNPGLIVKVTLPDGTVIDIKTVKDSKTVNPLFTEAAYLE